MATRRLLHLLVGATVAVTLSIGTQAVEAHIAGALASIALVQSRAGESREFFTLCQRCVGTSSAGRPQMGCRCTVEG